MRNPSNRARPSLFLIDVTANLELRYRHVLYFWTVARQGTIAAASEKLRLAQPTISAQWRTLEKSLGQKLFRQVRRTPQLTETGRIVYRYANDIFSLGQEMMDTIEGRPTGAASGYAWALRTYYPR